MFVSMGLRTGPAALLMSKVVVPPLASSDRCPDPECAVSASVPSGSADDHAAPVRLQSMDTGAQAL